MDLATIGGIALALAALVASIFMEGGSIGSLLKPSALILIFGGTIGATLISYRSSDLRKVPGLLASAFLTKHSDPYELIDRLVRMAERARREGLLALQDDIASLNNPLLVRGVQLIVDGTDPDVVKETMEIAVDLQEERELNAAAALDSAGGYAPTIGIIGTVMGLVQVLGNLSGDSSQLGHSIALAFLATLWGILSANLFWLPMGSKVKQNVQYHSLISRMCIAGVTGLQTGEAPRALREKLEVFLSEQSSRGTRRGGDDE